MYGPALTAWRRISWSVACLPCAVRSLPLHARCFGRHSDDPIGGPLSPEPLRSRIPVMAREGFAEVASRLVDIGRRFYSRGWVLGTSGNFSAVVSREPLRMAITASSVHKGRLRRGDILQCDERGALVGRRSPGHRNPGDR